MKVSEIVKLAAKAGFLATDKKPAELQALIIAADKKAKDAAGTGLGPRELEDKDHPGNDEAAEKEKAAKDRKAAHDKARDSMSARDKKAFDAMSDEEKDKAAKDCAAEDRDDDPEHTNDEDPDAEDEDYMEGADPSTPGGNRQKGKTAVDSAEVDRRIAAAVAKRDALHMAYDEVAPILGKVTYDSAGAVYRAALDKLGVDHKGVHSSALPAMLKLAKDKAVTSKVVAMDAAGVSAMAKLIPHYDRLK